MQGTGQPCAGRGTYGLQYQCVEYVRRFYSEAFHLDQDDLRGMNAIDFWDNENLTAKGFVAHPNGGIEPPMPGDIVVFSDAPGVQRRDPRRAEASQTKYYGHVAIVTGTNIDAFTVGLIEQNWSRTGTAELALDPLAILVGAFQVEPRQGLSRPYRVLGWL